MPTPGADAAIIQAILARIPAFAALPKARKAAIVRHTLTVANYMANPEGIPADQLEPQARGFKTAAKLARRVITEWATATGKDLKKNQRSKEGPIPATLAITAKQMEAYADLIAQVAESLDQLVNDTDNPNTRYEIKLDIASWRLDLQLPSSSTGLALELNGTLTGGRLEPAQEFGNLSLCTPNDLARFRSNLDPDPVEFGFAPATWHDGYIVCEPSQIMAMTELLKTATRVYLTLTVSDHHPNLGYMIHSLKAYSHT
jgi:hypothetical protein